MWMGTGQNICTHNYLKSVSHKQGGLSFRLPGPHPSFPSSCGPNPSADCIDLVCCHVREAKRAGWGHSPDVQQQKVLTVVQQCTWPGSLHSMKVLIIMRYIHMHTVHIFIYACFVRACLVSLTAEHLKCKYANLAKIFKDSKTRIEPCKMIYGNNVV